MPGILRGIDRQCLSSAIVVSIILSVAANGPKEVFVIFSSVGLILKLVGGLEHFLFSH